MPNPKSHKAIILQTAVDLILEKGYHATSIGAIARTAGVPKGSIYNHFGSKDELAAAAVQTVWARMDALEEDVLMHMEKIEDNEKKSVEQDKIVQAKRKELEETSKKNAERIALIDAKLAEWQKDREEKSSNIPKNILKQYDRVRQARNGTALAQIKNNACQGCFMELPPQVISETKLGQRMVACDNCNRLLYFDNETSID